MTSWVILVSPVFIGSVKMLINQHSGLLFTKFHVISNPETLRLLLWTPLSIVDKITEILGYCVKNPFSNCFRFLCLSRCGAWLSRVNFKSILAKIGWTYIAVSGAILFAMVFHVIISVRDCPSLKIVIFRSTLLIIAVGLPRGLLWLRIVVVILFFVVITILVLAWFYLSHLLLK